MGITEQIENLKDQRSKLLLQLDNLGNEVLGNIPAGFNNNILWNLGHILAIPQHYFYVASGHKPHVEQYYIQNYITGTLPSATDIGKEYEAIKAQMLLTLDLLKSDFDKEMFANFRAFGNLDFAGTLAFLAKHEANHILKINSLINLQNSI